MIVLKERLFEVKEGSNTRLAIKLYQDLVEETHQAWQEFCKKYGAEKFYADNCLRGLLFAPGKQPSGWINTPNCHFSGVFRPHLRDKACSEAAKEFKALPAKPSEFKWLDLLGIPIVVGSGRAMKMPGFRFLDGVYYLTASEGCAVPDDVVEVPAEKAEELLASQEVES